MLIFFLLILVLDLYVKDILKTANFYYFPQQSKTLHFNIFSTFFNPFPNKPWFLRVCSTSLLKTLQEKEKLLVMSFSHSVFYPFGKLSAIFTKFKIVDCKLFHFERV